MNQETTRSVVSDAETDPASRNEEWAAENDVAPPGEPDPQHQQAYPNVPHEEQLLLENDGVHVGHLPVPDTAVGGYPMMPAGFAVPPHPPPPPPPVPPPPPGGQQILQLYEAQMRDHAAAYASAAAGAAWAAAQIAADMANASTATVTNSAMPRTLPVPPQIFPGMGHYPGPPQPVFMDANMTVMPAYPVMDGCYEPPTMDRPYPDPRWMEDGSNAPGSYGHRRRKRQQRMPPSDPGNSNTLLRPLHQQSTQQQQEQQQSGFGEKRGRRRRYRNDGSNGNERQASTSNNNGNSSNNATGNRRARIRKNVASPNHSSDGGSTPSYFNKKKKARQPNDESLLGKTGVSALYEWCGKRRTNPNFELQPTSEDDTDAKDASNNEGDSDSRPSRGDKFEMVVTIDGMEWGRGRARTKIAAKQEAARRALQALLPGVAFEEASGILVQLPSSTSGRSAQAKAATADPEAPWKASASLEDLAPNLAKRLAIGQADDDDKLMVKGPKEDKDHSKKRPSKWHSVYPCTSTTTSDEEDENAYYESRGASVCSALLHAMVQIDERIPEAPSYSYEMVTMSVQTEDGGGSPPQLKRKAETGKMSLPLSGRSAVCEHRGPFSCTATMRLKRTPNKDEEQPTKLYDLLKAVGVAGSKREARHTASAKLLALLFPECEGMVQVKEAAEAARERYAASKALKLQSKRERTFMSKSFRWNKSNENGPNMAFAMASTKEPKLPSSIKEHFMIALGVSKKPEETDQQAESAITARQMSRQKQLDDRIAAALQKLNERDDEGRSLPNEPTVEDVVGRTILRRATPEDFQWISVLLDGIKFPLSPVSVIGSPYPPRQESEDDSSDLAAAAMSMWSSSSIVVLLCRAIAPYQDPPLGCAVLTLGFSMAQGRTLNVAQIGSKPHLPRERFLECLQSFARCMQCSLDSKKENPKSFSPLKLGMPEVQDILESHLSTKSTDFDSLMPVFLRPLSRKAQKAAARGESLVAAAPPLQSVQEESEGGEESGADSGPEKRGAKKEQDKPSKRSRVE